MASSSPERSSSFSGKPDLRPAERVRHFLLSSWEERHRPEGERLPSVRQVAKQVGVSTATVQSVYQKLADEGRIRSELGSGSYWNASPQDDVLHVGVNIPVPEGGLPSDWTYQIYGGIMHGLLQAPRPIVFRSLPPEALASDEVAKRFLEESRKLDGYILFPSQFSRRLRRLCEAEGRPVVDLNPSTESATVNFVSPDYYGASRIMTMAFRQTGRRRIAILVSPRVEQSVSVRLRCAGAAAGLGDAIGRSVEMRIFEADSRDEEAGRRAIEQIWADGFRPDAIYCAGDSLASGAVDQLQQMGISVPEDVSVVGGNGLGLNNGSSRRLTSMRHALDQLGMELVRMLMRRIETGGEEQPGIFLPPIFNLGSTTRDVENELLEALGKR